ncbi:MAG: isoaspartyl peptidase/L-asparaginase family protein [Myxococcota bacterium]
MHRRPVVVVHGGAGRVPPERAAHVAGCRKAAREGLLVLRAGGDALDAVQRAVECMEEDPHLNAGRGSALTSEGGIELDASLMEGTTLRAGGVCALPPFLHPIRIARAALEEGTHVLYAADGAAAFARRQGFEPTTLEALRTEGALRRLRDERSAGPGTGRGTVGAVACDAAGHVAAATSTGGTTGKCPGRVGDSAIPGAGTHADDAAGAASATGDGEALLRGGTTRTTVDLLRRGLPAREAARRAVEDLDQRFGGTGGVIVVSVTGEVGMAWSTESMAHAVARPEVE